MDRLTTLALQVSQAHRRPWFGDVDKLAPMAGPPKQHMSPKVRAMYNYGHITTNAPKLFLHRRPKVPPQSSSPAYCQTLLGRE